MVTVGEVRPLWEAQLMTVLRLTGIQSFSLSVKTPESYKQDNWGNLQISPTASTTHTYLLALLAVLSTGNRNSSHITQHLNACHLKGSARITLIMFSATNSQPFYIKFD